MAPTPLPELLESGKLKALVFIRHSECNTTELDAYPDEKMADMARILTVGGRAQAEGEQEWFRSLSVPLAVVSPAIRAKQTLKAMGDAGDYEVLDALYPYNGWQACQAALSRMGESRGPGCRYRKIHEDADAGAAFREHAKAVLAGVEEVASAPYYKLEGDNLAVFGHHTYLAATALLLSESLNHPQEVRDSIMDVSHELGGAIILSQSGAEFRPSAQSAQGPGPASTAVAPNGEEGKAGGEDGGDST